jgi:asparagine synthase (glutamine-hydrolysing)
LTKLELASGKVFGVEPSVDALPVSAPGMRPLEVVDRHLIAALTRPPCLVAFSGGRDSSAVLAEASAVARREGLDPPIAVSLRFPSAPATHESEWQELVIRHLGLPDWVRLAITAELDLVGPVAQEVITRHGVLHPPSVHIIVPMLREARGGTLVTGIDGDAVFRTWRWARAAAVLGGRARPTAQDLLRVGLSLAPVRVRSWKQARDHPLEAPWLLPRARSIVRARYAASLGTVPTSWMGYLDWLSRDRGHVLYRRSLDLLAAEHDATIVHPLLEPDFLAALGAIGGRSGLGSPAEALATVFGDLLPDAVTMRRTKADFNEVGWGPYARQLIASWSGGSLPIEFVDADRLREAWSHPVPDRESGAVLQALWLAESNKS